MFYTKMVNIHFTFNYFIHFVFQEVLKSLCVTGFFPQKQIKISRLSDSISTFFFFFY